TSSPMSARPPAPVLVTRIESDPTTDPDGGMYCTTKPRRTSGGATAVRPGPWAVADRGTAAEAASTHPTSAALVTCALWGRTSQSQSPGQGTSRRRQDFDAGASMCRLWTWLSSSLVG